MADQGITEGVAPDGTNYAPGRSVTRGQMASFIARFIEDATDEDMPTGDRDRFADVPNTDGQYEHSSNIAKLAEAGIVQGTAASDGQEYAPQAHVTRQQMGSFIRRALSWMDDENATNGSEPPEAEHDWFPDPSAPDHEANVDALADQGIVEGRQDGTYGPTALVRRDQMASFVMRAYDYAIEAGLTVPDEEEPTDPTEVNLESTTPEDGATDVAVDTDVVAVFDQELDTGEIALVAEGEEDAVEGETTIDDDTITFDPDENLDYGTEYTATIDVEDVFGNEAEVEITFTTEVAPTNQTFTVTPQDEATNTAGDARQYTVTNPVEDTEHTIALFPAENVSVDDNNIVTFADEDEDGDADGQGDVNAMITVVNGQSTDQAAVQTAEPVDGEITFTINSNQADSVVPVVYFDAPEDNDNGDDPDGQLNVDEDGEPVEDEPFGIGGQKNWIPAEADEDDPTTDELVTSVNADEQYFTTDGGDDTDPTTDLTYFWAAGDTFQIVDGADCVTVSQSNWVTTLSTGDELQANPDTIYDPDGASTFCIDDLTPAAPANLDAEAQSDSVIELEWDDQADADEFNIYRAEDEAAEVDFEDGDFDLIDTVARDAGEDQEYTDEGLDADTTYTYVVTAVLDDDESDASNEAEATTFAEGVTIDALSLDASVVNDEETAETFPREGIVTGGDEWQITFDREIDEDLSNAAMQLVDDNGESFVVACDTTEEFDVTCELNSTVGDGNDGDVLTITVDGADGTIVGTEDYEYPLEITNVTGFNSAATDGEWNLEASPDTTLNVDEDAALTFPTAFAADEATDTATITFAGDTECGDDAEDAFTVTVDGDVEDIVDFDCDDTTDTIVIEVADIEPGDDVVVTYSPDGSDSEAIEVNDRTVAPFVVSATA